MMQSMDLKRKNIGQQPQRDEAFRKVTAARNSKEDSMITRSFLPYDVMLDILSRLPIKSLARFRCVCKQWNLLTHDPNFVREQHERAMARSLGIISKYFTMKTIKFYNFDTADDINTLVKTGEMKDSSFAIEHCAQLVYELSNSVNGLVCAYNTYKTDCNFYVVNPTIQEYLKLPISCRDDLEVQSISLGFDASTGEYKVVRLICHDYLKPCGCEILTVGTHEWRYVGETPCSGACREPVFLHDSLYWQALIDEGYMTILKLDIKHEKFEIISPPEFPIGYVDIKDFSGHLSVLVRNISEPHVRIWMLMDNAKWIEKYSITIDNCKTESGLTLLPEVIGIVGGTILLETRYKGYEFFAMICGQDIRNRTFRKIYDGAYPCLCLHWESLVSPRKLTSSQQA